MDFIIRPITADDASKFNQALGSVARERRFLRLADAPSVESSLGFILSNLKHANPQWVALFEDQVVGWCDICRSDDRGSEHCGGLGMGIVASHRGRGIGRRLIEATLDDARESFRRVELEVYASNTAAISLYEKVGFAHEGRRRCAIKIDGQERDVLMMGILNPLVAMETT